jgi:hypothetical protein
MRAGGISVIAGRRGAATRLRVSGPQLWLVVLVALALLAASAANASAVIVRLHDQALSYEPPPGRAQGQGQAEPSSSKPVTYHGGPVMPSNTNYALYWDPEGGPEYPAGYESGLDRYFEDLAHDSGGVQNIDSVLTQYKDAAGEFANYSSHFGGALIDTDPYPADGCSAAPICLTNEQLRAEITKYVEAHKLPMDLQHEYFMLTPPGVESCLEAKGHECSAGTKHASYCSFHSYIKVSSAVIIYANNPYVDGTNCDVGEEHPNDNPSDATIGGGLAHEHAESVTDPELNAWYDSKDEEVADKCRTFKEATEYGTPLGKAPDGSNYNQVINGDLYWYQQVWSNETDECEQRAAKAAPPPTVTKVTPKTGPTSGKTAVTITGTGFEAPASVKFGATPATEVAVKSSTSITAIAPAGTAGTVNVTVTTSAGTSAINKKDHFKYK